MDGDNCQGEKDKTGKWGKMYLCLGVMGVLTFYMVCRADFESVNKEKLEFSMGTLIKKHSKIKTRERDE